MNNKKTLVIHLHITTTTIQNELRNKNIKFYNVDQVEYERVLDKKKPEKTNEHTHIYTRQVNGTKAKSLLSVVASKKGAHSRCENESAYTKHRHTYSKQSNRKKVKRIESKKICHT